MVDGNFLKDKVMEKYHTLRVQFEEAYKTYQEKLQIFNEEYTKAKQYLQLHKKGYREIQQKATECSTARSFADCKWRDVCCHPLHKYFKGYTNPEVTKYGIK